MARPHVRLMPDVVDAVAASATGGCVVALGGGADSAVLLAAAQKANSVTSVRGIFVDHHLDASGALRTAATALAASLDVHLAIIDAPIEHGGNLEARARRARYVALEANVDPGEAVLTGHTMDDQAETVMMRLAEGAGSTGLSGIPTHRGRWHRPLLGFTKAELRAVAEGAGLPFVDDPANTDDRFTRVRVRSRIMPVLEDQLGATVKAGMARSSALLRTDDERLQEEADDVVLVEEPGRILVPSAPLTTVHPAVASRICRNALRTILQGQPGRSSDIAAILATAATGATGQLTSGLVATHEGPFIAIGSALPAPQVAPLVVDIPTGSSRTAAFSWNAVAFGVRVADAAPPVQTGGRFTVLDARTLGPNLEIRGFQAGDRIEVEAGSTPVAELLRRHGVSALRRFVSPVAVVDASIAAVIGVRCAAWARPRSDQPCVIIERRTDVRPAGDVAQGDPAPNGQVDIERSGAT